MKAAACVGRVGGLAVALGVGAAVVTGYGSGVAWADTPDSSSSESSSSSASASSSKSKSSIECVGFDASGQGHRYSGNGADNRVGSHDVDLDRVDDFASPAGRRRQHRRRPHEFGVEEEEATAPTKNPKPKAEPAADPDKSADEAAEATGTKAPTTKVDAVEVKVDGVERRSTLSK